MLEFGVRKYKNTFFKRLKSSWGLYIKFNQYAFHLKTYEYSSTYMNMVSLISKVLILEIYAQGSHGGVDTNLPAVLTSHMGTGSRVRCSTVHTSSCYWPWKSAENGISSCWALASMWETQEKLLAPNFRLTQPWSLWPLGQWASGWKSFLSFSDSPTVPVIVTFK